MLFLRLLWQIPTSLVLVFIVLLCLNEYAIARPGRRIKDISYVTTNAPGVDAQRHLLDVYTPRKSVGTAKRPVVMFIHGGSWNSGNKDIYSIIGRRLSKQGVVAVIINYQLAPAVLVPTMADDCAQAVKWTTRHIADYGGDPDRIFVMGHSAGGGLAALLATNDQLFTNLGMSKNPVKGAILDDPAGLDMFDYLTKMEYSNDQQYLIPYGKEPAIWRAVSPIYYVSDHTPPMLMYSGERTYPSITDSSRRFDKLLQEHKIKHDYKVLPHKKHIPMVTQLFWQHNIIYRELLVLVGAGK
ncbi:alpha/beta hydrolase [Spirosoma pollinicola]|uniref:Alpha/beta hydrolase n=2 Tax=Spirosoma pollinicola TaxID=2057025 RepID=A0A2K8Z1H3_9BACT|nr:alpha/beta hydrolase [Spirosoma pollinicola]